MNMNDLFLLCGWVLSLLLGEILLISYKKRLFDEPDAHKVHTTPEPRLWRPVVLPREPHHGEPGYGSALPGREHPARAGALRISVSCGGLHDVVSHRHDQRPYRRWIPLQVPCVNLRRAALGLVGRMVQFTWLAVRHPYIAGVYWCTFYLVRSCYGRSCSWALMPPSAGERRMKRPDCLPTDSKN